MSNSLKSRVFSTDPNAWNNTWYIYVGAPLLAAIGATIGLILGSHLARGEVEDALVMGTCIVMTMLIGFTILAAIDRRSATES
jgi:cation transporter-like permease